MDVPFVAGSRYRAFTDPEGEGWRGLDAERIRLMGTPVGMQPTGIIRAAWTGRPIGAVPEVSVAAVHDGSELCFHLSWPDPSETRELSDTTAFPDAAAVALPSAPGAPLVTMGRPGAAVTAWYWRADEDGAGRHVVAEGLGTTRTVDRELVRASGIWKDGRWHVVLRRALRVATDEPVAQLEPGMRTGFGVAIWEGDHGERAGLKAFSGDWRELRLAPAGGGRSQPWR